ncbi:SusC/RagA family TonB-linked outer membrane protein [Alkalitalea saponilacus]|uniref:TonB-linked outer membrane protein, SusC/RagA family n=1 Tax=Alkalitalea saponilacus TaxID=889453 RepID=A0A1T5ADB9_9BACT|nr:TonB-dependent receptor [Alkalitalea saponilacus]ASB48744.1 SusC/RagA family TonB-linked outer membrane protein [Alkalitalea saponilacus]SKB32968.1 TonB-linked outer membrane protein, SusC/RagA family [Alkalitalea saponilacus]
MFKTIYAKLVAGLDKVLICGIFIISAHALVAQDGGRSLQGRVVDVDNNPLQGAVVNVSEATRIEMTNSEGQFELSNVNPLDEIYVSLAGYKEVIVRADFSGNFVIVLELDTDIYHRTIALPFHRQQKRFVVNSTSTVSGEELEKHPVTVLQNAFVGSLTGIATYEANSEPGWSETQMFIRGLRTMNGSARAPLIIVDNVERDISFLDAYPIESVTLLKDAAATAIYGMRGANGVVFVTTKRGEAGRTRINVNQEVGFQTLSGLPELQNSYNYALTVNQARYLDGNSPLYSDQDIQHYYEAVTGTLDPSLRYRYVNTNWHKEMMRDAAPQFRTNINASGGNENARYFVSFSYIRQEGLYDTKWTEWNDGYSTQHQLDRYNLRSNIDIDVTRGLNVSLDLGGRIDIINQPLADTWSLFTWGGAENLPIYPVFAPNGEFFLPTDNTFKNGPARIAMSGIDYNRRRNLYSNVTATGDLGFITQGLSIRGIAGFDAYNLFQYTQSQDFDGFHYDWNSGVADDPASYTYTRRRTAAPLSNPNPIARGMSYNINLIGSLNYDRLFNDVHNVSGQVMMRTYQNVVTGYVSSYRYLTYAGLFNYIYDNRYVAQFNAAYMGSDNYAKGDRYGFFPGFSAGWVMSEESWLQTDAVDLLKLRASIGRSGQSNQGLRRYPFQGEYIEGGGYNFGTSQAYFQGTYESAAGNANIKWEYSDMVNVGVDFDIWGRALYGNLDAFKEWRSNILVARSTIPDMYGVAVPLDSYGKAETIGAEITLGHRGNVGSFNYFVEGMFTWNRSKIVDMDEIERVFDYQQLTGQPIGRRLLLIKDQWASDPDLIATSHQDAIDNPEKYPFQGTMNLGNAVFVDTNGDRIIDDYDMIPYGYTNIPEIIPAGRFGFSWKGFDARVLITAYLNRTVETRENMDFGFGWGGATTHEVTKTWGYFNDDPTDPRNINAKYPRLSMSFSDNDRNFPRNQSTIWHQNGNFVSLRNVEIGYSLPQSLLASVNIRSCRVYFSGYNLYNWSHFENGFDPENPTNYIWQYPKTKSFSFGVNIGF